MSNYSIKYAHTQIFNLNTHNDVYSRNNHNKILYMGCKQIPTWNFFLLNVYLYIGKLSILQALFIFQPTTTLVSDEKENTVLIFSPKSKFDWVTVFQYTDQQLGLDIHRDVLEYTRFLKLFQNKQQDVFEYTLKTLTWLCIYSNSQDV